MILDFIIYLQHVIALRDEKVLARVKSRPYCWKICSFRRDFAAPARHRQLRDDPFLLPVDPRRYLTSDAMISVVVDLSDPLYGFATDGNRPLFTSGFEQMIRVCQRGGFS